MSDWEPSAGIDKLRARAALLAGVRAFLSSRGVLEVDTPLLGRFAITDPNIELFEVATPDGTRFLQSSPEYAMKRLLASGSGDIFQLVRCLDPASRAVGTIPNSLCWSGIGSAGRIIN